MKTAVVSRPTWAWPDAAVPPSVHLPPAPTARYASFMAKRKSTGNDDGTGRPPVTAPYTVLARKYRPQTFADLIGQDAMVRTLRNAFATGRIAQGYMLTGVRGVGKTTTARILARALNYSVPGEVDAPTVDMPKLGEHCQAIMESRHPDVVEMDAASNTGVDSVREITESARYRPIAARIKVFIIDEVHMLSKGAFNALLKTLEEPPEHVKFIFATTEIRKVPVTVLSRCQRFDLRRVDAPTLSRHFRKIADIEQMQITDDALLMIARASEGSVRDGLSILDQALASSSHAVEAADVRAMLGLADRTRIFDLIETTLSGDARAALTQFASLHHDGADPVQVLADLAEAVHVATRIRIGGKDAATDTLAADEARRAIELADRLGVAALSRAWQMLLKGLEEATRAPDPAAAADMVLIRLAHMASLPAPEDLARKLEGLSGASGPSGSGAETKQSAPSREPPRGLAPRPAVAARSTATTVAKSGAEAAAAVHSEAQPQFANFAELVAFVGAKRDASLRLELEDKVRLVRFEPPNIELNLTPDAPTSLPGELATKLGKWTGVRWVVILSREEGQPPLGAVRREREAAAKEAASKDPLVQRVLREFAGAEISSVRAIGPTSKNEDSSEPSRQG